MEEELAVFNRSRLLVEGTNSSLASTLPIAFNTAIPAGKSLDSSPSSFETAKNCIDKQKYTVTYFTHVRTYTYDCIYKCHKCQN